MISFIVRNVHPSLLIIAFTETSKSSCAGAMGVLVPLAAGLSEEKIERSI